MARRCHLTWAGESPAPGIGAGPLSDIAPVALAVAVPVRRAWEGWEREERTNSPLGVGRAERASPAHVAGKPGPLRQRRELEPRAYTTRVVTPERPHPCPVQTWGAAWSGRRITGRAGRTRHSSLTAVWVGRGVMRGGYRLPPILLITCLCNSSAGLASISSGTSTSWYLKSECGENVIEVFPAWTGPARTVPCRSPEYGEHLDTGDERPAAICQLGRARWYCSLVIGKVQRHDADRITMRGQDHRRPRRRAPSCCLRYRGHQTTPCRYPALAPSIHVCRAGTQRGPCTGLLLVVPVAARTMYFCSAQMLGAAVRAAHADPAHQP